MAALDTDPAYGARIALLKGTCVGTNNECRIQFKSAKLKVEPNTSIVCTKSVKSKISKLKKKQKTAGKVLDFNDRENGRGGRQLKIFKKGDSGRQRDFTKGPLSKEVPFGTKGRSKNFSGENVSQTKRDMRNERDNEDLFLDTGVKIRPKKPTNLERMRIIKAKLATLGEQNMTFQKSKKIKRSISATIR